MKAEIISIGTEILLGDILNTNAQFLSQELASIGIFVYHQIVVGDNRERILESYKTAFSRADIVITSGGIGPTDDDMTKELGGEFFNRKMILDKESLENIKNYFKKMNLEPTENNFKQGYFPEGSIILKNNNGTAPGCYLEINNKILIMLPGPPKELISMFKESVKEKLKKINNTKLISKTLRICGVGESKAEEILKELFIKQTNPTLALYGKTNELHLRITAFAETKEEGEKLIVPIENEIRKILGINIYGENNETLVEIVSNLLRNKNYKISIAESCTGGMLTSSFIDLEGASDILLEGCVTYSNESKISRLNVKKETLKKFGAVSEEVAKEMAIGISKNLNSNIGISTTGIAGPTGGTEEKPVGLIYIGLYLNGEIFCEKINLNGNRKTIRQRTTSKALDFLRRKLLEK